MSDRDPRFTGSFWRELFKLTGTHLAMSTASHAETDGQTERANRTIEEMLRSYISPHHNDWDEHLTAVEFAYNSSVQASTGYSPFYLNNGKEPHTPLTLVTDRREPVQNEKVSQFVQRVASNLQSAQEIIKEAQEKQAKYANQKRKDHTFRVGDRVLLSKKFLAHLPSTAALGAGNKFTARGYGPFEVLEVMNGVTCKLKLPPSWTIHPVVHGSFLTPWRENPDEYKDRCPVPPDPEVVDGDLHYEVEAFRAHDFEKKTKRLMYSVKWKGCSEGDNSWQLEEELKIDLDADTFRRFRREYQQNNNLPDDFDQPPKDEAPVAVRRGTKQRRR